MYAGVIALGKRKTIRNKFSVNKDSAKHTVPIMEGKNLQRRVQGIGLRVGFRI